MATKRSVIAVALAAIMLMSAGCAGLMGEDDNGDDDEPETDGNGEAQEGVDPADDETDESADEPSESEDAESTDAEETDEEPSEGESGDTDESQDADDSSGVESSDEETTESDEPDESEDDGAPAADEDESDDDEEVYTLSVEADSPVTLERNWEDASTTREPTDGVVEFSVIAGEYTLSAEGYEDEVVDVEGDHSVEMEPTNTLTIQVTDADSDEPIEGALVQVAGADGDPDDTRELQYEMETDESGIAQMDVQAAMNYVITVEADGYETGHSEVSLEREQSIALEPESGDEETHTLTVETQSDVPVTLERFSDGATTDRTASDGIVEFTVREGYYGLSADSHHDIHEEAAIHVNDDTTTTLQSIEGERIEMSVVDAATSEPVAGAAISGVCDRWYSSSDAHIVGETGSDGVAQPETLTPTHCDSTVSAEGYEDKQISLSVPDDDGLTIELEPA